MSVNYPNSLDNDISLYLAANAINTLLDGALTASGDNTGGSGIQVDSVTGFPTSGFIGIGTEQISYTGVDTGNNRFTGIGRGADGTTAASHADRVTVRHDVAAGHHNAVKDAIIATETELDEVKKNLNNILINGGFEIWQRNTTFTNPPLGTYTVDRFKVIEGGGTAPTADISRESTTKRTDSAYSMKIDMTNAGSGTPSFSLSQAVEDFTQFRGRTLSLSVWVYSTVANKIKAAIIDTTWAYSSYHGGTGWEKLTITKTIDTATGGLDIRPFNMADNDTAVGTYYIDNAMLVISSTPVDYVPKLPSVELEDCQRYYEKSYDIGTVPGTVASVGQNTFRLTGTIPASEMWCRNIPFSVRKRATPTMTVYSPVSGVSGKVRRIVDSFDYVTGFDSVGETSFNPTNTSATPVGGANDRFLFHWVADAEI